MRRVRLPLQTQSCDVWINQGQLQSQVRLSIHLASVFDFYYLLFLSSKEKPFSHVYGRRRKHKVLSDRAGYLLGVID